MEILEAELGVQLPVQFEKYDILTKELIIKYIKQMNPIEKLAFKIGKDHLGSSFNILKSNGFINWKKDKR